MFKKQESNMSKPNEIEVGSHNLISAGTEIKGDIVSDGNIRIDGVVFGTIKSKGKVVVGETGVVEGEIYCQNANISGTIEAKVSVVELLTLQASAKLNGEIAAGKLAVEPGAAFSGSCSMGGVIKEMGSSTSGAKNMSKEKTA